MTTEPQRRGIARNAISNWTAFLFVAGVSFFLSPFIVGHLGATAYGVWSLLVALVGYLGLLDFGVRGAVTRYIAHHHAVSDTAGASAIASAATVLFGCAGLIAILFAGGMALASPVLFNIPAELAAEAKIVLIVGGLTVASTLIGAVFGGIVTGLERFDISSGIEIFITTVRTIGVIVVLEAGWGLVALSWVHLASSMLYGVIAWRAARKTYPDMRLRFDQPLARHIRTILSFSVFLSVIHVLGVLIYYTDALVIAVVLPISAVAVFAIAGNLCEYASKVAGALSKMMTPRVSALTSMGSGNVGDAVLLTARLATLATTPIAITFFLRGESFIDLWMGHDFGPSSGAVLRVLAFMVWIGGARAIASSAIIGANRHRSLIPALGAEALTNLALSIVLAHVIGVVGVAYGTVIPSLIVGLGYIPLCLSRAINLPAGAFYRQAWLLPSLACLPFLVVTAALEYYMPAANLLMFFVQVLLILPLVPATALLLCATPTERRHLAALARRLLTEAGGPGRNAGGAYPMTARQLIAEFFHQRADLLRGLLLILIFRPAAFVLPRAAIWPLALACGFMLSLLLAVGRRTTRDFGAAFGLGWGAALALSARAHAKRFNEFALQQKSLLGMIDPFAFPIRLEASEEARAIINGPGSFVLAQAHFERATAAAAVFEPGGFGGRAIHMIALQPPRGVWLPHFWRVGIQLRQLLRATTKMRPKDLHFVFAGGCFPGLIEKLQAERVIVSLNVDAHWARGRPSSYSRPFAGALQRTFSNGAAKLARLGGCPLLLTMPVLDRERGEVRLRVFGPFRAVSAVGESADTEVAHHVLDDIEREIGRRPSDYVLEIGGERRWDAVAESWRALDAPVVETATEARAK